MATKAEKYTEAGYRVEEHEREHNGFGGDDGYHVHYVKHIFEPPFFLAEWKQHHATGITREIAVDALRAVIIAAK